VILIALVSQGLSGTKPVLIKPGISNRNKTIIPEIRVLNDLVVLRHDAG